MPMDDRSTKIHNFAPLLRQIEQKQAAYLLIIHGIHPGKMYKIRDNMVIGRVPEADIFLDEDDVSRRHAKLDILENNEIRIADLSSTNGTWVNGEKITEKILKDGDKIGIAGTTILKFTYQDNIEEEYQQKIYDSAVRDGLTGIFNKRYLVEHLKSEFQFALRHGSQFILIIFDIDHFKKINDTHGHIAGDYILKDMSRVISSIIRSDDIFARYGGEEFVILARQLDINLGRKFAERIRLIVQNHDFLFQGNKIPVAISLGVSSFAEDDFLSYEQMLIRADSYLYNAKNTGRNRVNCVLDT